MRTLKQIKKMSKLRRMRCKNIVITESKSLLFFYYNTDAKKRTKRMYYAMRSKNKNCFNCKVPFSYIAFIYWLTKTNFIFLFEIWEKYGFNKSLTPTIDRINSSKKYMLDNMQVLSLEDNLQKHHKIDKRAHGWHLERKRRKTAIILATKSNRGSIQVINHRNKKIFKIPCHNLDSFLQSIDCIDGSQSTVNRK